MKKATLSRILGLALALVLVLSTSVAFALPSGTSAIEGLPEMPTVPTMVTVAKGNNVTITLSEKLNWLNFVQNWQWLPIEFSEDGLTGTYSTADLSTQPGYGTWEWNNRGGKSGDWMDWTTAADKGENTHWEADNKNPPTGYYGYGEHREYAYGPGYYTETPYDVEWWQDDETGDFSYWIATKDNYVLSDAEDADLEAELTKDIQGAYDALVAKYNKLGLKHVADYVATQKPYVNYHADGIVRDYDRWFDQSFGNYELPDDFAYDGEAADGTHVRYGRYGECVQIAVTLTGVNFLGTDKTPVKTTVYWRPLEHYGKNVWNWYINNITEEYEDGSKLEAHFSSSKAGKLLGTKVIAAE